MKKGGWDGGGAGKKRGLWEKIETEYISESVVFFLPIVARENIDDCLDTLSYEHAFV